MTNVSQLPIAGVFIYQGVFIVVVVISCEIISQTRLAADELPKGEFSRFVCSMREGRQCTRFNVEVKFQGIGAKEEAIHAPDVSECSLDAFDG